MLIATYILGWNLICAQGLAAQNPPAAPVDPEQRAAKLIQKSLGVEFAVWESKLRRSIIRTKTPYGFKIQSVEPQSLAAQAGWQVGDVLLEWNGTPIQNLADLEQGINKSTATAAFKLSRYKKNEPIWSRKPWKEIEGKVQLKSE